MAEVATATVDGNYSGWTNSIDITGLAAGVIEAGDLVKLADRPGATPLSSASTSGQLQLTNSINASSNTIVAGEEVIIVRPYLVVLDSHDIDGNSLGGETIQYYRYRDNNWDGVDDFGEGNDMVDYGELTRDLSPPADILSMKNFVRTTGGGSIGDNTLRSSQPGTAIAVGTTFKVEGDLLEHTVTGGTTATQLEFMPGLGAAVAANAKVIFNDPTIQFEKSFEDEKQNLANWYQYFLRRELTAKGAVGKVIAEMTNANIGLHTIHSRKNIGVQTVKPQDYQSDASCTSANNWCDRTDYLLGHLYGVPLERWHAVAAGSRAGRPLL